MEAPPRGGVRGGKKLNDTEGILKVQSTLQKTQVALQLQDMLAALDMTIRGGSAI